MISNHFSLFLFVFVGVFCCFLLVFLFGHAAQRSYRQDGQSAQ